MENFGLGLVLQFTDRASIGIGRVANTISSLEQTARSASGIMNSLGQSMNALGNIGMTLSATVTAPLSGFLNQIMNWGIQRASSVQQLQIAFETFMGSARGASEYLDKVMAYAKTTPYAFDDLAQIAQNLIAYGMDADVVLSQVGDTFGGVMQALGDWSGATAKGVSGMYDVANVLARIKSIGAVDGNLLQSLQLRGLQASKMIGNIHNMSEAKAEEFIKTMSADDFISDLVKGIEEGTDGINGATAAMGGMVEKIKGTWVGAQDTFKSALKNAGLSLMGTYKDENGITHYKFLDSMTESLNRISDSIKKIATVFQPLIDFVESVIVKASEMINKIATMYSELSDDTKKAIGNVVAVLVMLGPALILFSQFGNLIVKTAGFLRTFTTGMGVASLAVASALFLMSTNFGGMRMNLIDFLNTVMTAVTKAFELIQKGSELTSDEIKKLQTSSEWVDRLSAKFAKVIGFIKIMADAWSDFTISEENYELMEKLGITEFVEGLLIFKDRMTFFFKGLTEGFTEFINEVKDVVKGSALAPFVESLFSIVDMITHGDRDFFREMGRTFGKVLPVIIAIRGLLPIISILVTGLSSIGRLFTGIFGGVGNVFSSLLSFGGGSNSRGGLLSGLLNLNDNEAYAGLFSTFSHPLQALSSTISESGSSLLSIFSRLGSLLTTPLGIILAIVAAMGVLYVTSEDFRNVVNNVVASLLPPLVEMLGSVFNFVMRVWDLIKAIWTVLEPVLLLVLIPAVEIIGAGIRIIFEVISAVLDTISAILSPITGLIQGIAEMFHLTTDLSDAWKLLSVVFKGIGYILEYAIVAPLTGICNAIILLMRGITWLINKIPGIDVKMPEYIDMPWDKTKKKKSLSDIFNNDKEEEEDVSITDTLEHKTEREKLNDWFSEGFSLTNTDAEAKENPETEKEGTLLDTLKEKLGGAKDTVTDTISGITNNNSSPAINFNENSIVIQTGISSADEAEKLAKELMRIMAREINVNANATQNSEVKKSAEEMNYLLTGGTV